MKGNKVLSVAIRLLRSPRPHLALAALALAAFACLPAAGQAIRMAWFPVPPHSYLSADGENPTGPSIELFERIASRMGYKVQWVGPIPINRLGTYQTSREMDLDGTILHIKTPAIQSYLYYPSKPYFVAKPCLALRADNPLREIRGIEDIKGYRIGFVKMFSSFYPPFINDHRDEVAIDELSGEDWLRRNLEKLMSGRLDAVYERNQYNIPYEAIAMGIADRIKVLHCPAEPIPHYFVFQRNSPRAARLLEAYERAVADMSFDYDAMMREEMGRRSPAPR